MVQDAIFVRLRTFQHTLVYTSLNGNIMFPFLIGYHMFGVIKNDTNYLACTFLIELQTAFCFNAKRVKIT